MRGAGGVDAQQQVDVGDVLAGDRLQRVFGDGGLIAGGVRAGVAGPQLAGQRLDGLIAIGQQRMKSEDALEVAGRALLVGMCADQRGVARAATSHPTS